MVILQVMLYSGQLDIIVAAPLTERMLWNLQWKYQDEYKTCKKQVWKVRQADSEVAGYVRHIQNFYQVCVPFNILKPKTEPLQ